MSIPFALQALGPLGLVGAAGPVPLGGRAQQVVLARLLVAHPAAVSAAALAAAVWGDGPPPQQLGTLQAYVSRLRRLLAPGFRIPSDLAGYRLVEAGGRLDLVDVSAALLEADTAAAARRWAEVVVLATRAVGRWRGDRALDPFADEPWALDFCRRADSQRVRATELLVQAHLHLGAPGAALTALEPLLRTHPFNESLVILQMLALYRQGRQNEAVEAFHRCRAALDRELGLEPSPALHRAVRAVLSHDSSLAWEPPPAPVTPRLLPPRAPLLVGRDALLEEVASSLASAGAATLHGLPGVGKTSVAAELAHRHPGPVCWVPAANATGALRTLTEFASRLGISPLLGEAELLSVLRSWLGEHRGWLLVFDNAEGPDLVRSLLPGGTGGAVLVTSTSPAWSWLGPTTKVDPLGEEAAVELIVRRTGRHTEDARPLARATGGLVLALEQACSYIDETGMTLDRYLQIFERRHRDLLSRGAPQDHPHPVTATWELLVDDIATRSPLAVTLLEVCSFLSSDDLAVDLLADVDGTGRDELELEDAIAELVHYSLVDRSGSTLRLHRLVQDVVRTRLDPERCRQRATAAVATLTRRIPGPAVPLDEHSPWAALSQHTVSLLTAGLAAGVPLDGVLPLALGSVRYLRSRLALKPAHELVDLAITLVTSADEPDRLALGELYACRGDVLDAEGRLEESHRELQAALACFASSPEPCPELSLARTRALLGHVLNCADRPEEAYAEYVRALDALRRVGTTEEVVAALIGLGYTCWSRRDFGVAADRFREALAELDRTGWVGHPLHPEALSGLAMMLHEQGEVVAAVDLQRTALDETTALYGRTDHPALAYIHDKLGWELGLLGDWAQARTEHERATAVLRRLFGPDDPRLAMTLSNLGVAQAGDGDREAARASQQQALTVLLGTYGPDHRDARLVTARLAALEPGPAR